MLGSVFEPENVKNVNIDFIAKIKYLCISNESGLDSFVSQIYAEISGKISAVNDSILSMQQVEFEIFFRELGEPWGDDQEVKDVYRKNFHLIRDSNHVTYRFTHSSSISEWKLIHHPKQSCGARGLSTSKPFF